MGQFGLALPALFATERLAGITTMDEANRFLRETFLHDHNRRFAIAPEEPGSAFVPFAGNLDDTLCVQDERTVGNDNCVRYKGLTLRIPKDRHRHHYVKARVRVHGHPDGHLAIFHGPRRLAVYEADGNVQGGRRKTRRVNRFDARRACGFVDKANTFPTTPQAQHQQQKRSIDVVHKAVNSICYRQGRAEWTGGRLLRKVERGRAGRPTKNSAQTGRISAARVKKPLYATVVTSAFQAGALLRNGVSILTFGVLRSRDYGDFVTKICTLRPSDTHWRRRGTGTPNGEQLAIMRMTRSIAVAAAAALVFAATPTKADTLAVQGIVAVTCAISTADAGAGALDLSASQTDLTIANVTEDCSDADGYTVTIATTNGTANGLLVSQDVNGANATDLTYSIKYDAVAVTLVAGSGTAAIRSGFTASQTVVLAITYTIPGGGLPADTYTDTLTLTITAG